MTFSEIQIPGVFVIENRIFHDVRGIFQKNFQKSLFAEKGIKFNIKEHFFSISNKGVIRGMHFQYPPYAQDKLVYSIKGSILDVVLDLRTNSPYFRKIISVELTEKNRKAIFIPKGCAHGFQSLENGSITVYSQSEEYFSKADTGISPLSLELEWPVKEIIISDKDKGLNTLEKFDSPFKI
ncbi:MAG: dTDP-4-dehydrorhamnose 3,5-epimerase [Bacteroidales bacterium]|nr:dTDP-4-dehydrorhamnose 3,5-epimerase [Bacteroidales bacterium]